MTDERMSDEDVAKLKRQALYSPLKCGEDIRIIQEIEKARANEKFLERGLSAIHCENENLRIHIAELEIKVETLKAENAELRKQNIALKAEIDRDIARENKAFDNMSDRAYNQGFEDGYKAGGEFK